jgi:hypothetical protein
VRQTRDTFLHFLSDNLASSSIPVHNVRRDTQKPDSSLYKQNAVNIKFLNVTPEVHIGTTLVEICVIHVDELTALTWVKAVFDLLGAAYYTAKLDYSNPANPVSVGTNIYWDRNINFGPVYNDSYFDYRCNLTLSHKVDS